jgi:hypothetical protein
MRRCFNPAAFSAGTHSRERQLSMLIRPPSAAGAEPPDESSYRLITGNILNSDGELLCRLVRNVLTLNPGDCSKIVGDHIGYEIRDSAGNMVFKVETRFTQPQGMATESYVTTLGGTFYDKAGSVAFKAHEGEHEHLEANAKIALGFTGAGFGFVQGFSDREMDVARIAIANAGSDSSGRDRIHPRSGTGPGRQGGDRR